MSPRNKSNEHIPLFSVYWGTTIWVLRSVWNPRNRQKLWPKDLTPATKTSNCFTTTSNLQRLVWFYPFWKFVKINWKLLDSPRLLKHPCPTTAISLRCRRCNFSLHIFWAELEIPTSGHSAALAYTVGQWGSRLGFPNWSETSKTFKRSEAWIQPLRWKHQIVLHKYASCKDWLHVACFEKWSKSIENFQSLQVCSTNQNHDLRKKTESI